jgi:DNA-binding transcriptional ArsR family regulator
VDTYYDPFDALGEPTRRSIVDLLRDGPQPVGQLAARLPISRPAVSQHLRVLERAGLVTHRVDGTRHLYEVDLGGLEDARRWLDRFWDDALARFKEAAEREGSDT